MDVLKSGNVILLFNHSGSVYTEMDEDLYGTTNLY